MRRLWWVALAVAIAGGCGGSKLKVKADAVGDVIEKARSGGAQDCAPVELAMAESHHAFARQELSEGNYFGARDELRIAEVNANEALRLSPLGKCVKVARAEPAPTDGDADGDGVPNSVDDCPKRPEDVDGFADADGCPDSDNDADGLGDEVDECPDEAEDRDAFEDDDGCPDVDNDGDGLSDRIDQCPDKAADTEDGCPAYENVVVTDDKIEIRQTIYFTTGKATIKRVSHAILDEVAQALVDNPSISIRIEGHTDSRGKEAYNLKLSQDRADSVRQYLVGRGIDAGRLETQGFGERMPIADNRTGAGRDQNRRVEFVITRR